VHHAIETSIPAAALNVPVLGAVVASLFFGQFLVMVFLMLSGFCPYYPCVRKESRTTGVFGLSHFHATALDSYHAAVLVGRPRSSSKGYLRIVDR